MEIEYFIKKEDWEKYFEFWKDETLTWIKGIGVDMSKVHNIEIPDGERAHYSKRTIDFEFDFPFGRKELYGLAYRGDFDLQSHQKGSGQSLEYFDEETKQRIVPHVIEPSMGVERSVLAVLASAYREEEIDGEKRMWLDLPMRIAPYRAAVFPLLSNKSELVVKAQEVRKALQGAWPGFFPVAWDASGNIGKRYRKQDEIGTPYCFTIDFQTLEDNTITVRDRNTMKQERIAINEVRKFLEQQLIK
jgi:glycyl-tRNA synthetase